VIDLVLYNLQKQFKISVQLCTVTILDTNLETGVIHKNVVLYTIKKAIMLPITLSRQFLFELTHRDFAITDLTQQTIIIRSKDLPTSYTQNIEDYFIVNGKTLYINKIEPLLDSKGYVFMLKGAE
jgi:hypothetical protein